MPPFIILQNPQLDIPHFSPHFHNRHLHRKVLSVSQPGKIFFLSPTLSQKGEKNQSKRPSLFKHNNKKNERRNVRVIQSTRQRRQPSARTHPVRYKPGRAGFIKSDNEVFFFFFFFFLLFGRFGTKRCQAQTRDIYRVYMACLYNLPFYVI